MQEHMLVLAMVNSLTDKGLPHARLAARRHTRRNLLLETGLNEENFVLSKEPFGSELLENPQCASLHAAIASVTGNKHPSANFTTKISIRLKCAPSNFRCH